ncbi:molybdenum cofactor synthesis domain-containing protein [Paraoerskovia marina]|uniref:Molybdenum cofactor synthesis domain-containing protein n=1 Tax=Paraoerskovia marina TaxID=545619 RepID=A0A1H1P8P8_9CELL|nr:MogA/MoaB family molybdenum cofactor biosynthesis protein [Paraoerskovia marina]SDS07355.1 molybdenum cofactor synthesis domain-containing protein [Paraoerskovia marina]
MTTPRTAVVVTVSDRCARGEAEDRSGPTLVDGLEALGFTTTLVVVPDGVPTVRSAVAEAIGAGTDVVLTTGGTGVGPRDVTPEALAPLLAQELPGVADAVRRAGASVVPTAVLSRGVAGIARRGPVAPDGTWTQGGGTVVVALPGSVGGVRDGLAVVGPLLGHLVDQLAGGDHAG